MTRTPVLLLLGPRSPSEVPGFVPPVIVDAIKRMAFWAFPQMPQDPCLEWRVAEPWVVDRNPALAVSVKAPIVGIEAALLHRLPRLIEIPMRAVLRGIAVLNIRAQDERVPVLPSSFPVKIAQAPSEMRPITVLDVAGNAERGCGVPGLPAAPLPFVVHVAEGRGCTPKRSFTTHYRATHGPSLSESYGVSGESWHCAYLECG